MPRVRTINIWREWRSKAISDPCTICHLQTLVKMVDPAWMASTRSPVLAVWVSTARSASTRWMNVQAVRAIMVERATITSIALCAGASRVLQDHAVKSTSRSAPAGEGLDNFTGTFL